MRRPSTSSSSASLFRVDGKDWRTDAPPAADGAWFAMMISRHESPKTWKECVAVVPEMHREKAERELREFARRLRMYREQLKRESESG